MASSHAALFFVCGTQAAPGRSQAGVDLDLIVPVQDAGNDDELHREAGVRAVFRPGSAQQAVQRPLPSLLVAVGAEIFSPGQRFQPVRFHIALADGEQP